MCHKIYDIYHSFSEKEYLEIYFSLDFLYVRIQLKRFIITVINNSSIQKGTTAIFQTLKTHLT